MNRRGFIGAILAASAAPAIVRAESLMRVSGLIIPAERPIVTALTNQQIIEIALKRIGEPPAFDDAYMDALIYGQSWVRINESGIHRISAKEAAIALPKGYFKWK